MVIACSAISAIGQEKPAAADADIQAGEILEGRLKDLGELRGSVVLVSFRATWCTPCTTDSGPWEKC
jgi:hypothetical protein